MIGVFSGFILPSDPIIKSIGLAFATGILIDAFLIRMTHRTWIVRARRKGPRTPPWAFSHGKRPQTAGKRGHRRTTRERRKSLQVSQTQSERHTTENRGVPGSSPGLAIPRAEIPSVCGIL